MTHSGLRIQYGARFVEKERKAFVLAGISSPDRILQINDGSIHTLAAALLERVYYKKTADGSYVEPTYHPTKALFQNLGSVTSRIVNCFGQPPTPVSPVEFSQMYKGRKKAIYERAVEQFELNGVQRRHAKSRMFVKLEKVKYNKAPRAIQPRDPIYNVAVGCYLKPIEHRIYRAIQLAVKSPHPVVMKGFNADQVGEIIHDHWNLYDHPVGIGLDAKAFDQHVGPGLLKLEHSVYTRLYRNAKQHPSLPPLAELLKWQIDNEGVGNCFDGRLKYKVKGRRFSGDMNTAMGNCLLMCISVQSFLEKHNVNATFVNNGDDCVIFTDRSELELVVSNLTNYFESFVGFQLEIERPVFNLEEVEFCQSHPVLVGGSWRMVRNFEAAREKDSISLLNLDVPNMGAFWLGAVGECGLALCSGVPVFQELYQLYMRHGLPSQVAKAVQMECGMMFLAMGMTAEARDITPDTRVSFFYAFGVTPDEQIVLEEYYRKLTLSFEVSTGTLEDVTGAPF